MGAATNQNTSLELANALLMKSREAHLPMPGPILQQMVYLASGWNLAINNRPLILDQPEAWAIGAIYRRLYQALEKHGDRPVPDLIEYGDDLPFEAAATRAPAIGYFSRQEYAVIDRTWTTYGSHDAEQLAMLTQGIDTPFQKYFEHGRSTIIPDEAMREYFLTLGKTARGRGVSAA